MITGQGQGQGQERAEVQRRVAMTTSAGTTVVAGTTLTSTGGAAAVMASALSGGTHGLSRVVGCDPVAWAAPTGLPAAP